MDLRFQTRGPRSLRTRAVTVLWATAALTFRYDQSAYTPVCVQWLLGRDPSVNDHVSWSERGATLLANQFIW